MGNAVPVGFSTEQWLSPLSTDLRDTSPVNPPAQGKVGFVCLFALFLFLSFFFLVVLFPFFPHHLYSPTLSTPRPCASRLSLKNPPRPSSLCTGDNKTALNSGFQKFQPYLGHPAGWELPTPPPPGPAAAGAAGLGPRGQKPSGSLKPKPAVGQAARQPQHYVSFGNSCGYRISIHPFMRWLRRQKARTERMKWGSRCLAAPRLRPRCEQAVGHPSAPGGPQNPSIES